MANPIWTLGSDQPSTSVRRPHFAKREAVAHANATSVANGGGNSAPDGSAISAPNDSGRADAPPQGNGPPTEQVRFSPPTQLPASAVVTKPLPQATSGQELLSHLASQLSVISAYVGAAQKAAPASHQTLHSETLADAQRELRVAATTMRSLRAFLELSENRHRPKSINAIVEQTLTVLSPRLKRLRLRAHGQLECSPACKPQDDNLGSFLLVIMEHFLDWCTQHPDAPRCLTIQTTGDATDVGILVAVGTVPGEQHWKPAPASRDAASPNASGTTWGWAANLHGVLSQLGSPAGLQSVEVGSTASPQPTPVCRLQFSMGQAEEAHAWTR